MTTLWLVRHALPLAPDGQPPSQVCYGHTDWPADATLTRQAAVKLAQALAAKPHRRHHARAVVAGHQHGAVGRQLQL